MAEFKKKNKYNFLHSRLVVIILFLLLIFLTYKVINLIKIEKETAEKKELTLSKINELKERESILKEDIEKMKTEEGIEDIIREKYQVVKENEKMVIIVDDNKDIFLEDKEDMNYGFLNWFKNLFRKN